MLERLVSKEMLVQCACGQEWPVANPDLEESITCGVCGRRTFLTPMNVHARNAPKASALFHAMENLEPQHRVNEGIRLVKDGRYAEASDFFRSVVSEVLTHRDAFYGLGYCFLKLGKYEESYIMLGIAAEMGHPGVEGLLNKVRKALGIRENDSLAG